ncbi:MAG: hypothetical protein QGH15_14590 [Kiritimatiellia bacterium]|nr:hypothetical protein [Kiritimatiellia bacterium]
MGIIIKVMVLVALIKILLATENPVLCAGIYAGARFIFAMLFTNPFFEALIGSAIAFGLACLYFWLLDRFKDSGMFWVVLVVGLVIGLV